MTELVGSSKINEEVIERLIERVLARQRPETFLFWPEVVEISGYCRGYLYTLMAAGKFPRQVQLGDRKIAWRARDIAAWQRERIAAAHGAAGDDQESMSAVA